MTFGVDLGTTNSVISRLTSGRPVAIPIAGSPVLPSVVLFGKEGVVVGREARNLELEHPERTIRSVKRRMGQPHRYRVDDRELSPEEVSAEVLRALKLGAEAATGETVCDVVITVPAYFDDAQRRATLRAGELAGLNVLRLLNEPTSASLVYDHVGVTAGGEQPEVIIVYDLGGGTFDVSVLEVFQGVREVRATTGNTALGGDDFDELLLRHFLDELKRHHALDPRDDPRAMARLRRVAEQTKIALSSDTAVRVREEFLLSHEGKPVHLDLQVTRRQFERMILPLLDTTVALSRKAVEEAHLNGQRPSRICLVGGSTRIPLVRKLLEGAFGVEVHEEVDPDLAVGLGASIQAGLLKGDVVDRILVDVAAHSLGLRVFGQDDEVREDVDTFAPLIRKNAVLPAQRSEEFYTMVDDQERIEVEVFQGESPRTSLNTRVGAFYFPLQPVPAHSPVRFEFAYDLNGVVKVSVSQPGRGNEKTVALSVADAGAQVQASPGPGDSAIERKVQALLEKLGPGPRAELEQLLANLRQSHGGSRSEAEDAILDFFLEHDAGEEAP